MLDHRRFPTRRTKVSGFYMCMQVDKCRGLPPPSQELVWKVDGKPKGATSLFRCDS
jgi:hypothetical protein